MAKLNMENRELASQMPDGAWQKHLAHMSSEELQAAKDAVALHKAQEEHRRQNPPPDAAALGLEGDEDDEISDFEAKFDRAITWVALAVLFVAVVAALGAPYIFPHI